jgi:hypothetical protein
MVPDPNNPPAAEPVRSRRCENCGAQLLGEHCYACGQPTKGLVRHFSSIVGDFLDSVFNFDTRTLRTLGPLLFKPGHLTNEYFHGHRVRYVSPVRLFFFLCIAAFFALQLTVDIDLDGGAGASTSAISRAETVEEVTRLRDDAMEEMRKAREEIPDAPGARVGMDVAIAAVEAEAKRRIGWIQARDAAILRGETPPSYRNGVVQFDLSEDEPQTETASEAGTDTKDKPRVRSSGMNFNGRPWDPVDNPLVIDWLPERANGWINQLIGRAKTNSERIEEQPRLLVEAFIEALPQTLFVLLPVFALMLKLMYLFKRRLYMEHLIVALHSHAFLCAAILLLVGFGVVRDQTTEGFWHSLLGWCEVVVACWMPVYLFLMQKRVYGQGWILTSLKFFVLGILYLILISVGAGLNLAVSLVAM